MTKSALCRGREGQVLERAASTNTKLSGIAHWTCAFSGIDNLDIQGRVCELACRGMCQ